MIGALISPIASLLGTVVETQMVKQKSKQKILEDAATHDNKWELLMAKNMNNSWSDEIWTVAIVFIMFLCFVPFMQPYIQELYERERVKNNEVIFVRLEQLYPFPAKTLANVLKRYKKAKFIWCQEEPKNMGAWNTVRN